MPLYNWPERLYGNTPRRPIYQLIKSGKNERQTERKEDPAVLQLNVMMLHNTSTSLFSSSVDCNPTPVKLLRRIARNVWNVNSCALVKTSHFLLCNLLIYAWPVFIAFGHLLRSLYMWPSGDECRTHVDKKITTQLWGYLNKNKLG